MCILGLKRWYSARVNPGESRTDHAHDGLSSHYVQETTIHNQMGATLLSKSLSDDRKLLRD